MGKAALIEGGPYDGTVGEVVREVPWLWLGPPGAESFGYRHRYRRRDGVVVYRYSTRATAARLRERGVSEEDIAIAVGAPRPPTKSLGSDPDERAQRVSVTLERGAWRMWLDGEQIAELPHAEIDADDVNTISMWVESVMHKRNEESENDG